MRRGERRDAGGPRPESPVPAGKASLEEPPDGPSAGQATGPGEGRRSTESEVYDDGTNTFFCCDPGLALCRCSSVRRIKPST
ncbi:PTDSS2 isoform 6 [Pan troglodytes]|uniref:PTDSS2 isoform 6 n=2 Tax=Pan troglodytes TaxID=9598 RepID=A0A6D2XZ70_PANTR|nr:PTDSS2 isoform 6 [Pan troglodytes]